MRVWTGFSAGTRGFLGAVVCAMAVACGGCGEIRETQRLRERAELIEEMRVVLTPEVQQALLEEARAWRLQGDKSAPVARRTFGGSRGGGVMLGEGGSFIIAWPRRRMIGKGLRWVQCVRLLVHPDLGPEVEPRGGRFEVQFFEYEGKNGGIWESPVPLEDVLKSGI